MANSYFYALWILPGLRKPKSGKVRRYFTSSLLHCILCGWGKWALSVCPVWNYIAKVCRWSWGEKSTLCQLIYQSLHPGSHWGSGGKEEQYWEKQFFLKCNWEPPSSCLFGSKLIFLGSHLPFHSGKMASYFYVKRSHKEFSIMKHP